MAPRASVTLSGFESLLENLKEIPQDIDEKIVAAASRTVANLAAKDMRDIAGRLGTELDDAHRYADRSVIETYRKTARKARAAGGSAKKYGRLVDNIKVKKTPKRVGWVVTTGKAYWAMFYEFGSRHQPARPVFRTMFIQRRTDYQERFTKAIQQALDRRVRKAALIGASARRGLGLPAPK